MQPLVRLTGNRTRFVLLLTVLLALGFLATTLVSYWVAHDSLSEHLAEDALPLTSDNVYSEIQRDLFRPIFISSLMAQDTFVRDWALDGEREPERMVRYLAEIQERYGTVSSFFVSERTRTYYHATGVLKSVSRDDPGDAWFFRARSMQGDYEVNVDWDTADRSSLVIFINYKVFDYSGSLLGITGVGLSMDAVKAMLENYRSRFGRDVFFVDRQGQVTLHGDGRDSANRLRDMPGMGAIATRLLASPGGSFTVEHNGTTVYVNSRLVPEFDWYLLVAQNGDPAQKRIANTLVFNLLICAAISAVVLVLANLTVRGYQRRLEEMASTDKLTGAANRQVFDMIYDQQKRLALRRGTPLSMILFDIDHFKAVNDTYGHQAGDRVIRAVAEAAREVIRGSDVLCRWGGEEFLLLAPDCDMVDALRLAEKIRDKVETTVIAWGGEHLRVTVSLGVAQVEELETENSVLKRADDALYDAKRQGRNRVVAAVPASAGRSAALRSGPPSDKSPEPVEP